MSVFYAYFAMSTERKCDRQKRKQETETNYNPTDIYKLDQLSIFQTIN